MNRATALFFLAGLAGAMSHSALAQVPVDDEGNEIGTVYSSDSGAQLLANDELEQLVGPIALYPDDLLAIVLPASTYPLQVVEAARFLERLETDESLEPDEDWDDSVVALINYPEVVEMLNEDLDWTWALGEAVVAQQADVLTAVESFRDRAYSAGNLRTDEYQVVAENDDGIIEITPASEEVIYVPYYEPERVVVYQTRPVYHYYSRPYPVYYYPYSVGYSHYGYFWGVTTAFRIGWLTDSLHVWHHSHYGHPYYGRAYRDYYWYRRPSIRVHNRIYYGGRPQVRRHYRYGDYWRPRHDRRLHRDSQRITRSRYYGSDDHRRRIRTRSDRGEYRQALSRQRLEQAERRGNDARRERSGRRVDSDAVRRDERNRSSRRDAALAERRTDRNITRERRPQTAHPGANRSQRSVTRSEPPGRAGRSSDRSSALERRARSLRQDRPAVRQPQAGAPQSARPSSRPAVRQAQPERRPSKREIVRRPRSEGPAVRGSPERRRDVQASYRRQPERSSRPSRPSVEMRAPSRSRVPENRSNRAAKPSRQRSVDRRSSSERGRSR